MTENSVCHLLLTNVFDLKQSVWVGLNSSRWAKAASFLEHE